MEDQKAVEVRKANAVQRITRRIKKAFRAARGPLTVTYADGFSYSADVGRGNPKRIQRALNRSKALTFESATYDLAPMERNWILKLMTARTEWKQDQARLKVEKWKAENDPAKQPGIVPDVSSGNGSEPMAAGVEALPGNPEGRESAGSGSSGDTLGANDRNNASDVG